MATDLHSAARAYAEKRKAFLAAQNADPRSLETDRADEAYKEALESLLIRVRMLLITDPDWLSNILANAATT